MNSRLFAALIAVTAFGSPLAMAADPAEELSALVQEIGAKLKAGERSAEGLAPELKKFDQLLAAHADNKTDAVAQILFMQAALYAEVLGDVDQAIKLVRRLKTDFPQTTQAARADQVIAMMERRGAQLAAQKEHERTYAVGKMFPDFAETDLDGKPLSIANYKGKVVLIDFWATWCGPCIAELPTVLAAYKKYHSKGFEIIGISLDRPDSLQKLKDFAKEHDMPWPQFYDGKFWANKL